MGDQVTDLGLVECIDHTHQLCIVNCGELSIELFKQHIKVHHYIIRLYILQVDIRVVNILPEILQHYNKSSYLQSISHIIYLKYLLLDPLVLVVETLL